jgi:hypothetical protein
MIACTLHLRREQGKMSTAPRTKVKLHVAANQRLEFWPRRGVSFAVAGTDAATVRTAVPEPLTVGDVGFMLQVKRVEEGAQASETGTPIP